MRFFYASLLIAGFLLSSGSVTAQTDSDETDAESEDAAEGAADETSEEELGEDGEDGDEDLAEGDEPRLRAPTMEMPNVNMGGGNDEESAADDSSDEAEGTESDDEWPEEEDGPDDSELMERAAPPSADPTRMQWSSPTSVLSLNGYFRVRGELWDKFYLDRNDAPFNLFRPASFDATVAGGCDDGRADEDGCDSDQLRFANMRLRLEPTIALSDDVKVHMMIDVFDNMVLGSTPDGSVFLPPGAAGNSPDSSGADDFERPERVPGVPLDSFSTTQNPPQALRNDVRDSIYIRRAWAEVTNRGLGQLRFGRMGSQWGLGMLANDGRGIDGDFSSDVDRLMLITKLFGFHFAAAFDFAVKGVQRYMLTDLRGIPFDAAAQDDVRQYVFAIARREDPETEAAKLQRGDWVLNGGIYFVYRSQLLSTAGVSNAFPATADLDTGFVRRNADAFIPDLWGQFKWQSLRLEIEAAMIIGSIENIQNDSYQREDLNILQFGFAFEGEYRLLDDKLGIRLYTGYATGDADIDGLSARQGLLVQQGGDNTASHFQFHPNYRIDLILWRNIMGQVAGAWYLKPGISYDLIRNPFGQLFGARVDAIYSRAAQQVQTYGGDPNLGLELDLTIYYRSEDGPEIWDGFYAQAQFGYLFPFGGLGYRTFRGRPENPNPAVPNENFEIGDAYVMRLILGVNF